MIPAGAFYYRPPGPPFANPAMPAVPALPYAPAAGYPAAVLMQAPPGTWYYPYRATVQMQAPPSQPQPPPPSPCRVPVHAVWADNLDAARCDIGYFAAHARCVAVKVHYPGVVVHGAGGQGLGPPTAEKRYAVVKANVDALKPLQVGIAVLTDGGRAAAWEFNLSDFDPAADAHAAGSLAYLQGLGLSCDEHRRRGIPMEELTRVLRRSGLFGSRPGVSWVTHTGAYHLAYLIKVLGGGGELAGDVDGFLGAVRRSLGEDVYDVARMAADCQVVPEAVGLEYLAHRLSLAPPLSARPLAGAGSVLALEAFMKLRAEAFGGEVARYRGVLQGLQVA